ncbi:MAG: ABC transporter substrate-binding protein [Solirubrobacterales bacterium]
MYDADNQGVPATPLTGTTRRAFLGRSAASLVAFSSVGSLLSACGGSGGSEGQVNVLAWESYIDPEIKKLWAEAYPDISLVGIPAGNDAELLTKLRAGGADSYDVTFCNFGYCPLYLKEGLVETINLDDLDAGKQLYPQFREDADTFTYLTAPGKAIGLPGEWAPTALAWNTTVDATPSAPYTWADLWDPSIPSGKIGLEGLSPEGYVATAALAMGYPASKVYELSQSDLDKVVAYMREIKPFRLYEADPLMRNALRTADVWAGLVPTPGFAGKINEEAGDEVTESVIPEEGSIGFIDGPMLVKNAKNRDNALKFMNWFGSDPKLRQYVFEAYRAAPCNQPTVESLEKQGGEMSRLVKELKGPEPQVATEMVQAQPPSDLKAYTAAWDSILA